MIWDLGFGIWDLGSFARQSRCALSFRNPQSAIRIGTFRNPQSAIRNRRGISLMEVLISMFVMLFGLMGVAAIFPVGNYYVVEGEKHDLGSLLAANAFEELQARGMLRPEVWLYAGNLPNGTETGGRQFIQPVGSTTPDTYNVVSADHPGHAFVIDPMGAANVPQARFPFDAVNFSPDPDNPWLSPPTGLSIAGEVWPVRRLTLPQAGGVPLDSQVAEVIFRLRDDLAVELPERDDAPSIQRWSTADIDPVTGTPNNTPTDPTDDTLLSRQYQGNFSWLATIVPSTEEARLGLQPASRGTYLYEVSVAVFYKRVPTPSAETERLLRAEMLTGGELVMYGDSIDEVDKGLEGIKSGAWVAVMGVNQTTGAFMLKWYRLLALDEETHVENLPSGVSNVPVRYAMLLGPDWHALPGTNFVESLRVAILPGVASVVTREMVLERDSLWNAE